MKKYFLILISTVFLLSCESEKDPCNIEYKLNEPGGFGRNEVTFLINDSIVWYSKGSGVSTGGGFFGGPTGGKGGFKVYKDVYINIDNDSAIYTCGFITESKIECKDYKFSKYNFHFGVKGFNLQKSNIELIDIEMNPFYQSNPSFSYYSVNQDKFNVNVYLNVKDSICYGDFEGVIYHTGRRDGVWTILDSVNITKGTFDFKFSEIKEKEIK